MMMRKVFCTISGLLAALCICLAFSAPAFADGISVKPDVTSVTEGESFTVTVTLSGNGIYAYEIHVRGDDLLFGETDVTDTSDGGSQVSVTAEFTALSAGTATISVSGSYSDGKVKYDAGSASCSVKIEQSPESRSGGNGRAADADKNYRQPDGSYINNREPKQTEESGEPETETSSITDKETQPATYPQIETQSSAANPADPGKGTPEKSSGKLWIPVGGAILLLIIAAVLANVLIRKRWKQIRDEKPEEEIEKKETIKNKNHE